MGKQAFFFEKSFKIRLQFPQTPVILCNCYPLTADLPGGLVAQSVEHRPFKAVVPGSSPGQLTIVFCKW